MSRYERIEDLHEILYIIYSSLHNNNNEIRSMIGQ